MQIHDQNIEPVRLMHQKLMKDVRFDEIEHVPNQFLPTEISIQENCLCISYQYFTKHYEHLMGAINSTQNDQLQKNHWIAEVLLVLNGQNGNAWNSKKILLDRNALDIERQLKFNAAVCYKNKKSSSYYEYRIRLYEKLLKQTKSNEQLLTIYESESKLIFKILARFFRNYYCWMYRNRLFKLFLSLIGKQVETIEIKLLHKFIESNPNDYSAYSRLIPIIRDSSVDITEQRQWIQGVEDFCALAFQHKQSYLHIQTYKKFLQTITISKKPLDL